MYITLCRKYSLLSGTSVGGALRGGSPSATVSDRSNHICVFSLPKFLEFPISSSSLSFVPCFHRFRKQMNRTRALRFLQADVDDLQIDPRPRETTSEGVRDSPLTTKHPNEDPKSTRRNWSMQIRIRASVYRVCACICCRHACWKSLVSEGRNEESRRVSLREVSP